MFKHPKTYTTEDFEEYDPAENAKDFNIFAFIDVERGEGESFGKGFDSTPMNAEGRIALEIQDDAGTVIGGRVQLAVLTRNNRVVRIINEWDLEELAPPASGDRGDRYPFPIQEVTETMDRVFKAHPYKVGLLVQSDGSGSGTLSLANSYMKADGMRVERTQ